MPLDQLRRAPRRVRRAHAAQVARIRVSIEKFGSANRSSSVRTGHSSMGHGVVEAARAAGIAEIPVIFVEHLSPAEQRLLSITLNRLGETGQWDEEALRIEFAELIDLARTSWCRGSRRRRSISCCWMTSRTGASANSIRLQPLRGSHLAGRRPLGPGLPPPSEADARDPASYERLMLPGDRRASC